MKARIGLFTIAVNDYQPKVCAETFPLMHAYAKKIGASFTIVTERMFHGFKPNMEKFQLFDLGRGNDFNILVDADMAVLPECPDVTKLVDRHSFGAIGCYGAHNYFKMREAFLHDGRDLGVATNFVVTTAKTHLAWAPPPFYETERNYRENCWNPWTMDEFFFSLNVAKCGYPFVHLPKTGLHHLSLTTGPQEGRDPVAELRSLLAKGSLPSE